MKIAKLYSIFCKKYTRYNNNINNNNNNKNNNNNNNNNNSDNSNLRPHSHPMCYAYFIVYPPTSQFFNTYIIITCIS